MSEHDPLGPHRLGLHLTEGGASVAVYAPHATAVHLCLFDSAGAERRVALTGPRAGTWTAFVPEVASGQLYGFRAEGPFAPGQGHFYNVNRLLLDPYARAVTGSLVPSTDKRVHATLANDRPDDSAPLVPRSVALPPEDLTWMAPLPRVPWGETVIYEAHVKGLTQLLPGVPEDLRGTYAALGHEATIAHLKGLGVTSLELLPIHAFINEPHLEQRELTNYWGYNTIAFFAPHPGYATTMAQSIGPHAVVAELRGAIDLLHRAGIEVILDVVYNHTGEGGTGGRQIAFRGLDNWAYYRHDPANPGTLFDTTGCGNTLDFGQPRVVQLAMDSLRYWVSQMGIDGFRFDLATTLGRNGEGYEPDHPFLQGIITDPTIASAKLIAEPWDVGPGGWQTGNFPEPMAEWNDRFRDAVRDFWLVDAAHGAAGRPVHGVRDLATRLAGSSDMFGHGVPPLSRGPLASINFVASHDGFTAHDLTAFQGKHNEANGENNRDGSENNHSWNHGAEGATDDQAIIAARHRSLRNLLGTLILSAGVPMFCAGDEFGRSQGGNNNAYCQDNEISWLDWEWEPWQQALVDTVRHLLALRREHEVLRPTTFYEGRDKDDTRRDDLAWFRASGETLADTFWFDTSKRGLQMMRSVGDGSDALIVVNGYPESKEFTIVPDGGAAWHLAWDSSWDSPSADDAVAAVAADATEPGAKVTLPGLSMRLYLSERG